MRKFFLTIFISIIFIIPSAFSQISLSGDLSEIDYANPKDFEIGGITISGAQFLDNSALISLTGLAVGDKIKVPGEKITKAIENLWKQGLFEDVKISATKIQGNLIFIDIYLQEKPRLSKFSFLGVKKSEADKLRDEIKITRGDVVTDNVIVTIKNKIKKYFTDKGFMFITVDVIQKADSSAANSVNLTIDIKKNAKVKINQINFYGNTDIPSKKLKHAMKKTKEKHFYRLFASSRFYDDEYDNDKTKVIEKFNELGYRDVQIVKDSIYKFDDKTINIDIHLKEGQKYYFRNISWVGNTIYPTEELNTILNIKKAMFIIRKP